MQNKTKSFRALTEFLVNQNNVPILIVLVRISETETNRLASEFEMCTSCLSLLFIELFGVGTVCV